MSVHSPTGAGRASAYMILAGLLIGLVMSLAVAPAARANEYGLPQLVSRPSSVAQPNGPVNQLAVSSNGRYILYELDATNMVDPGLPAGSSPNAGGVYRYDTQTGASELVAYGYFSDWTYTYQQPGGAENAAISADGRYVLFDSNQLFPGDPGGPQQLYIRDMTKPVDDPGSYTMPIGTTNARAVGPHGFSNDGTRLLWTGYPSSSSSYGITYWTDLSTGVTRPVSVAYDQSSHTMNPNLPLTDPANTHDDPTGTGIGSLENAVLSGDGTTVAWYSGDVTQDTPTAPGENPFNSGVPGVVWRRIADGDRAVTRRVTTAADIENPACTPATPITQDPTPPGPCDDAQLDTANMDTGLSPILGTVVGLSDDGQKVAVLADGHPRGSGISSTTDADVYVVGMFPGTDPVTTIQPITRALPGSYPPADTNAPITAATMSGDGRYVAFVTQRILFPMDPPTQVGTFPAFVGANQLYLVDLQDQHIQLLSVTPSGAEQDSGPPVKNVTIAETGVTQPALSEDARTIGFMSSADNLAPGDANGLTDAFVVQRAPTAAGSDQTGPQVEQLPATAPDLSPQPDWSLLVDNVSSAADGRVTVTVEPPAAGSVSATVADGGAQLAAADATASGPGPVTLTLQPHVTDAQGKSGMARTRSDTAVLHFTPLAGVGGPITDSVPVTFKLPAEKIGARTRAMSAPRALQLTLTLPAPGRVTVAATRQTRQGHRIKTMTVARATRRGTRAGSLPITLAPSRAARRSLPPGRVSLHLQVRFLPAIAGPVPPLTRTLTATLPRAEQKGRK